MRVTRVKGALFRATRITGPRHNMLCLELSREGSEERPLVETLPRSDEPLRLDAEEVLASVLSGLKAANIRLGASYSVVKVQFLPTDSPPASVYALLAEAIVDAAHADGL